MKKFCIVAFTLISIPSIYAQVDSVITIEEYLENFLDESMIDEEDSQLLDMIEQLLSNKVDINKAELHDFLTIPFLDINTAEKILTHRNKYGQFFSLSEIGSIEGINTLEINRVLPFLKVEFVVQESIKRRESEPDFALPGEAINYKIELRSRVLKDLQERRGFTENIYSGSNLKIYQRIKGEYHNYRFGGLVEKDAGENSLTDFNSFFLYGENILGLDKIAAGDYLVEFGQGLALWSPYSFSKGSEAVNTVNKNHRNLVPYTSTDENKFFRGAAIELEFNGLKVNPFYSYNKIDGNIDVNNILSLPRDGYHRTVSEIERRKTITENVYGSIINYQLFSTTNIGFLYFHSKYNYSFIGGDSFELNGDRFNFYSFTYQSLVENLYFSGEIAYNGKTVANIHSILANFSNALSIILSVRNYPASYSNIFAGGFGESSNTQNEFGIYTGLKWRTKIGTFNTFYDQFKFPSATFDNPLPTVGSEFLLGYQNKLSKNAELNFRYNLENKEVTELIGINKEIINRKKQKLRTELSYSIDKTIRLKSRLEFSFIDFSKLNNYEEGLLVFQDARFIIDKNLNAYTRVIFYQTDSYESRIYEFENDLTGVMNNPALYGKGIKWYLLIRYSPLTFLNISFKYSENYKPEEKTLSSGYAEIKNNLDNKIGLQIDLKF